METNWDSYEYMRNTHGLHNYQVEGYETCLLVLFVCCYIGGSHIGILLALSGIGCCWLWFVCWS
jgi:hypothetical protein